MGLISRIFIRGLIIFVPIGVTIYVIYLLGSAAEASFGALLKLGLPDKYYVPGMGLTLAIMLVFVIGTVGATRLVQPLLTKGERLLFRLPLIKTIYGVTRDFIEFTQRARKGHFERVVTVHLGHPDRRVIGFVTRDDFSDLPDGIGHEDMVLVFFPMSYQVGGYTVAMPRSEVHAIDMTVMEGIKFALTAGMTTVEMGDVHRQDKRA